MANGDLAAVAASLKKDNRTAVGSKLRGSANVVAATCAGPDGSTITNDTPTALTAETATAAAHISVANAETPAGVKARTVVIPHLPNTTGNAYDKRNCRTQYFWGTPPLPYDSTKAGLGAKRCYVNITGSPLDANGVPTTVALAINAETTALTALGQAVTNYEQVYRTSDTTRAVAPGKYLTHPFQTSLYAPYAGWTAQQG